MDSDSDGSFAWTDTDTSCSNSSSDSDIVMKEKTKKNDSDNESVSGKTFKKKLQEELLEQNPEVKPSKRKRSTNHSESEDVSPQKKKIKREPESDIDTSIKLKEKKNTLNHETREPNDESYLKLKVKQEKDDITSSSKKTDKGSSQSNLTEDEAPVKKKKKKSKHDSADDTSLSKEKQNGKNHSEIHDSDESYLNLEVKQEEKVAASNSRKRKASINNSLSESNTQIEDNVSVKKKKKKSKHHHDNDVGAPLLSGENNGLNNSEVQDSNDDSYLNLEVKHEKILAASHSRKKRISVEEKLSESNSQEEDNTPSIKQTKSILKHNSDEMKNNSMTERQLTSKRNSRISERLQFEDEISDMETSQIQAETSKKSGKLKKFCKNNVQLKVLKSKLDNEEANLSADDELWLIRCPKDVDLDSFQSKKVTLEGKCKLKLSDETYEGTVENEPTNMAIVSQEQNTFAIKSFLVAGSINFRKRIPKTHIQDDSTVKINHNSFIPLPETKIRHPLFGYDYKKSIKLPANVKEQLKSTAPSKYKKNKHKTSVGSEPAYDICSDAKPKEEHKFDEPTSKKKKKHKKSIDNDAAPKKSKKSKYNLESAEAWDSEKAIEENLFNF